MQLPKAPYLLARTHWGREHHSTDILTLLGEKFRRFFNLDASVVGISVGTLDAALQFFDSPTHCKDIV